MYGSFCLSAVKHVTQKRCKVQLLIFVIRLTACISLTPVDIILFFTFTIHVFSSSSSSNAAQIPLHCALPTARIVTRDCKCSGIVRTDTSVMASTSANSVGRGHESLSVASWTGHRGLLAPHCQFIPHLVPLARSLGRDALSDLLGNGLSAAEDGPPKSRYGLGISCRHKSASCTAETQFTGSDITLL